MEHACNFQYLDFLNLSPQTLLLYNILFPHLYFLNPTLPLIDSLKKKKNAIFFFLLV